MLILVKEVLARKNWLDIKLYCRRRKIEKKEKENYWICLYVAIIILSEVGLKIEQLVS